MKSLVRLAFNLGTSSCWVWHRSICAWFAGVSACVVILLATASASAALLPDEVAIIAMAGSKESKHIAEYYAKARGIPSSHILLLEGKPQMVMRQSIWEKKFRPTIIKFLERRKLAGKIRCLVTCWDVPLRIEAKLNGSPDFLARKIALVKERATRVAAFDKLIATLDDIGQTQAPRAKSPLPANVDEQRLKNSFNAAMQGVQKRNQALTSDAGKARVRAALEQAFFKASGSNGMLQMIAPRSKTEKPATEKIAQQGLFIGLIQGLQQAISAMEGMPDSVARDQQILDLVESKAGLFGTIRWIDQHLMILQRNESGASFDSELSMIFYADYSPLSQQPNSLHYSRDKSRKRRTMMVARLAAPTVKIVEKMIDDAIAMEKTGLKGNVYIDARGLKPKSEKKNDPYFVYDQSLRDLAKRLRKHTSLTVVSDDKPELFQAGNCPDAALYCGWYSVRRYIDAFDWKAGAVAYHLASFEAKWLREPLEDDKTGNTPWCPYMLKDGVCATLGPVMEPYLSAFPLPDDFFPLLLTGKSTLAEVFYRSKRFNSWALVLVGDPLYTPYKVTPMLEEKDLPERLRGVRAAKRPRATAAPAAGAKPAGSK